MWVTVLSPARWATTAPGRSRLTRGVRRPRSVAADALGTLGELHHLAERRGIWLDQADLGMAGQLGFPVARDVEGLPGPWPRRPTGSILVTGTGDRVSEDRRVPSQLMRGLGREHLAGRLRPTLLQ